MEYITLLLFCFSLLMSLLFDFSILISLGIGLILFFIYGMYKGFSLQELIRFSISGIKTVKDVLITFFLIGMLTAIWRASGTIPVLVCLASNLIQPSLFLMMTFLMNSFISFLTGTAFGTAATMGVICSTMGYSLGISPIFIGGAVLSGAYFGDRCSPISTSALLVSKITDTDLFLNVQKMLKTAFFPFLFTVILYAIIGFINHAGGTFPNLKVIFSLEFNLSFYCILPALILLFLALCKVNVKIAMSFSILSAFGICLWIQQRSIQSILWMLFYGYTSTHLDISKMLDGGGIFSMFKVAAIVCISSAYSGIFKKVGLFDSIQLYLQKFAKKTNEFTTIFIVSLITAMISCNQTLTIMLTKQLSQNIEKEKGKLAIYIEDSAVMIAPLIPWSIASAVPLASVGASSQSILLAFFLYLLPITQLILNFKR